MEYLIRFVQAHETFRQPELEALSTLGNTKVEVVSYFPDSPFCIVKLQQHVSTHKSADEIAADFISRSFLSKGIYELWAQAADYSTLHEIIRRKTPHLWPQYSRMSFKFTVDAYYGKRSMVEQRQIINSFSYLGFRGKVEMKTPDAHFLIFEEWDDESTNQVTMTPADEASTSIKQNTRTAPKQIYFCRFIGGTRRHLSEKHDLKKRPYISTTSMEALLALVTANLALTAPGKLVLDPFVGTGGFMVAASELGAVSLGCDIDGRSFRGKGKGLEKGVGANFRRYNLQSLFGDCITSDLTNTPYRMPFTGSRRKGNRRWVDVIISDPPYGIREGLKVLGNRPTRASRSALQRLSPNSAGRQLQAPSSTLSTPEQLETPQPYLIDGVPAHLRPGYIAPKRPYSFTAMLDDILDFAAHTLVDGGRLAFWMPSVNDGYTDRLGEEKSAQRENLDIDRTSNFNHNTINGTVPRSTDIDEPAIDTAVAPPPQANTDPIAETETKARTEDSSLPTHPLLTLKHVCTQSFNKWSRKLLIYERIKGDHDYSHQHNNTADSLPNDATNSKSFVPTSSSVPLNIDNTAVNDEVAPPSVSTSTHTTTTVTSNKATATTAPQQQRQRLVADDLNPFRKAYFRGFQNS